MRALKYYVAPIRLVLIHLPKQLDLARIIILWTGTTSLIGKVQIWYIHKMHTMEFLWQMILLLHLYIYIYFQTATIYILFILCNPTSWQQFRS